MWRTSPLSTLPIGGPDLTLKMTTVLTVKHEVHSAGSGIQSLVPTSDPSMTCSSPGSPVQIKPLCMMWANSLPVRKLEEAVLMVENGCGWLEKQGSGFKSMNPLFLGQGCEAEVRDCEPPERTTGGPRET